MKNNHSNHCVGTDKHAGAEYTVVFVHGFLDAAEIWDDVIGVLATRNIETVSVDLAGMGQRIEEAGPFTLERFASDVGALVDQRGKPFVIVGQSMGAQVAELVAAARPERAKGLVLITPVPLAGTHLPEAAHAPFSALGGQADKQAAVRRELTADMAPDQFNRLVALGLPVLPEVVAASVQAWNAGHASGQSQSKYSGPVLVIGGDQDSFVTSDLIESAVLPRFSQVQHAVADHAGHWPHAEQPELVARLLEAFLAKLGFDNQKAIERPKAASGLAALSKTLLLASWVPLQAMAQPLASPAVAAQPSVVEAPTTATSSPNNTAGGVRSQGWTQAFAEKSADTFGAAFHPDIVLEASVLVTPIEGKTDVMTVMATASKIYESLVFTQDASNGRRNYLEWDATAFGGLALKGVTILEKDDSGKIVRVAIHHRPLEAALRFSQELRTRLDGKIDGSHFFNGR